MGDSRSWIVELLARDKRYRFEAYVFVFEALQHGHKVLGLGKAYPAKRSRGGEPRVEPTTQSSTERHLSPQELCEAIRHYALDQYGYMAKCVLNSWGVRNTSDFGEIVFNLIEAGEFRKTDDDRREDFDGVFDFDQALSAEFAIHPPEKTSGTEAAE